MAADESGAKPRCDGELRTVDGVADPIPMHCGSCPEIDLEESCPNETHCPGCREA